MCVIFAKPQSHCFAQQNQMDLLSSFNRYIDIFHIIFRPTIFHFHRFVSEFTTTCIYKYIITYIDIIVLLILVSPSIYRRNSWNLRKLSCIIKFVEWLTYKDQISKCLANAKLNLLLKCSQLTYIFPDD